MQGALATMCHLPWGTLREKELTKGACPLYPLSAIHQEQFDQEKLKMAEKQKSCQIDFGYFEGDER